MCKPEERKEALEGIEGALSVTMVGSLPPVKGISRYCFELASALGRRVPIDFVPFRRPYPTLLYPGHETVDRTLSRPAFHPEARVRVRRGLSYWNPATWLSEALRSKTKVLHYQWVTTFHAPIALTFLFVARIRGAATVVTAHNVTPHKRHPLDVHLTRAVLSLADRVILHSSGNAREALKTIGLPPDRIAVIRHGLLFAEGAGVAPGGKAHVAREHLGLPQGAVVLLFFGGIREHKGLGVLLGSLPGIAASTKDVLLVVAGQDWGEWGKAERLISDLGLASHVKPYLRYIPEEEVVLFFTAADAVVLPYVTLDSQSGVGMVALAQGRPMVVTDAGGLPELVLDRSCIARPGDSESLLGCLKSVVENPSRRRRLAGQARRLAATYSWDTISERTIKLYRSVRANRADATARGPALHHLADRNG